MLFYYYPARLIHSSATLITWQMPCETSCPQLNYVVAIIHADKLAKLTTKLYYNVVNLTHTSMASM